MTRRDFAKRMALFEAAATLPSSLCGQDAAPEGVEVNDVQSQLNRCRVRVVVGPSSLDDVRSALKKARREGIGVSVCGGRHAMGGQQFGRDGLLIDMKRFNRVVGFDRAKGHVTAEGGIEWPELIGHLLREQAGDAKPWAVREKQTGVDRVSLGGSLASNVHGRGLRSPPIIADVESFDLVDADGAVLTCSRRENAELFGLAIGGYGLFGLIARVTLRLVPRAKVERVVDVIAIKDLLPRLDARLGEGFVYGDCQYATDLNADARAHAGVFACYRPVAADTPIPENPKQLSAKDWAGLYTLARTDKKRAFARYSDYYRSTSGQVYWSDTHQLAGDFDAYREAVDPRRGTEMITEVYVRREAFLPFMERCREDFLRHRVDMTYGTIRFIERDAESFLAWAREPSVCIVCNLHVAHTPEGRRKAAEDFRRILDRAIEAGGSYYLTYHRWATRAQVEACYPRFVDFLRMKRKYDPRERFQSDWYRHYKDLFADQL